MSRTDRRLLAAAYILVSVLTGSLLALGPRPIVNAQVAPPVGYSRVQDEGSDLTRRKTLNLTGAGVSCVDNSGSSRTDCTIAGGGGSPGGSDGQLQYRVNSTTFGGLTGATTSSGTLTRIAVDPSANSSSGDWAVKLGNAAGIRQESGGLIWVLDISGSVVMRWSGSTGGMRTFMHSILVKTSAYTVQREDTGYIFTNTGASASTTLTYMNNPWIGMVNYMSVVAAQPFCLAPNTGETLRYGSAGPCSTICSSSPGAWLDIRVVTDGAGAEIHTAGHKEADWTCS